MRLIQNRETGDQYAVVEDSVLYYIVRGALPDRPQGECLAIHKDYIERRNSDALPWIEVAS